MICSDNEYQCSILFSNFPLLKVDFSVTSQISLILGLIYLGLDDDLILELFFTIWEPKV